MKGKGTRRAESQSDWKDALDEKIYKSFIAKRFRRFINWLYSFLINGFLGKVFTSYYAEEVLFYNSRIATTLRKAKIGRRVAAEIRVSVSKAFEKSRILTALSELTSSLIHLPLKLYGALFLSMGGYGIIAYIVKVYVLAAGNEDLSVVLTCGTLLVLALVLMASRETFAKAALRSGAMNVILFGWLGLPRDSFMMEKRYSKRYSVVAVLGMVLGALTYFVHPLQFILLAALIFGVSLVFTFPEIGVLVLIALVPFSEFFARPSFVLCGTVMVTAIGFFVKLIRGKRVARFSLMEFSVLAFGGILLLGGLFSAGGSTSFASAALYFTLLLGYFLTVNLIRTGEWVRRCVVTLLISAGLASAFGALQVFTGSMESAWLDASIFSNISVRITGVFDNPNVFAAYLLLVLPFVLAAMLWKNASSKKLPLLLFFSFLAFCLVETWSRGAWLGALISLVLFFLIYSRRSVPYILLGGVILSVGSMFFPENVVSRFTSIMSMSDSSSSYRIATWRGVGRLLREHWVGGIGVGESAFSSVYPMFSYAGIEGIRHTHNLYLQIISELGVAGLITFLAVMILFVQNVFEFIYKVRNQGECVVAIAGFVGIIATLIMGLTDYIWYSSRLFLMFWLVFGLVNAYVRIGLAEVNRSSNYESNSVYAVNFDLNVDNL